MLKVLILFSVISTLALEASAARDAELCEKGFRKYKKVFHYDDVIAQHDEVDEAQAEELFDHECEIMREHNEELYDAGLVSYKYGINQFSGLPNEIVYNQSLGLRINHHTRALPVKKVVNYPPAPKEKNWCYLHTPVRDQDSCGACWAFATTAVIEAAYNKVRGVQISLSEQNLIDCDKANGGCEGGWPGDAFTYVDNNGLAGMIYEYVNKQQKMCLVKKYKKLFPADNFIRINDEAINGDEERLKRIVYHKGPVVVAVHICDEMLAYATGVFMCDTCNKVDVNHAVVLCGYGEDPKYGNYWIVRNSWSSKWGEQGYIRIARGRNTVGIATYAIFPEL